MAIIIVEGPDGSGKSTTVAAIQAATGLPVFPTMGPPKTPQEIIQRVKTGFEADEMIFDRFSLISEMVYGPILRGNQVFDYLWLNRLNETQHILVYLRPSYDTLLRYDLQVKAHKGKELIAKVEINLPGIVASYDCLMERIPWHIKFDRDIDSLEELCVELTSLLADRR